MKEFIYIIRDAKTIYCNSGNSEFIAEDEAKRRQRETKKEKVRIPPKKNEKVGSSLL